MLHALLRLPGCCWRWDPPAWVASRLKLEGRGGSAASAALAIASPCPWESSKAWAMRRISTRACSTRSHVLPLLLLRRGLLELLACACACGAASVAGCVERLCVAVRVAARVVWTSSTSLLLPPFPVGRPSSGGVGFGVVGDWTSVAAVFRVGAVSSIRVPRVSCLLGVLVCLPVCIRLCAS